MQSDVVPKPSRAPAVHATSDLEKEAARKNESQLKGIFESTVDAILAVDQEGKLIRANGRFAEMWHVPLSMLQISNGQAMLDLVLAQLIDPGAFPIKGNVLRSSVSTEPGELTFKDGRIVEAVSASLIIAGTVAGQVWSFRDITKRKRAEETLREAADQYRCLVEQSIAGIYIIQDGKLAYVNPRYVEIFGYDSGDELVGRDPLSLVAEIDRDISVKRIRQRLKGEPARASFTFTGVRKDGAIIDLGVHGSRATHRGRPAIIGLMQDISEKTRAEKDNARFVEQLKAAFASTVEVITIIGEMRDPYTTGHERRVASLAGAIGAELGFNAHRQEGLRMAGHLHDVGKMTIPSDILSKPGKLSDGEFQLVKEHVLASYEVLKRVEFPWSVAQIALQHHERIDGSGYPNGLKGDAILFDSRILAVADVVEAMSSHRPYRAALGMQKALAEIERGRGTAYDPDVTDACLRLVREKSYQMAA